MYKVFSRQAGTQEHTGAWGLTGRQVGRQLGGAPGRWAGRQAGNCRDPKVPRVHCPTPKSD